MVTHIYKPRIEEAEEGKSGVQGQPELHGMNLYWRRKVSIKILLCGGGTH